MSDCSNEKIPRDSASDARVRDVMVTRPKTLSDTATVGDVRELFKNPHVATALLVDGPRFAGAIDRDELPDAVPDDAPAATYVRDEHATTTPDTPMGDALARLDKTGTRRLVVLADDGTSLRGLLCLDSKRTGFCVEAS